MGTPTSTAAQHLFLLQSSSKKSSSASFGCGDVIGLGRGVLGVNLDDFGHLHGQASLALADFAIFLSLSLACVLLKLDFAEDLLESDDSVCLLLTIDFAKDLLESDFSICLLLSIDDDLVDGLSLLDAALITGLICLSLLVDGVLADFDDGHEQIPTRAEEVPMFSTFTVIFLPSMVAKYSSPEPNFATKSDAEFPFW